MAQQIANTQIDQCGQILNNLWQATYTEASDVLKNFCDQIECDCTDGGQLDDLFDGIGDQTINTFQGTRPPRTTTTVPPTTTTPIPPTTTAAIDITTAAVNGDGVDLGDTLQEIQDLAESITSSSTAIHSSLTFILFILMLFFKK